MPDGKPKSHTAEFDAALKTLTQDRGAVYGHPLENFERMAAANAVLDQCSDPAIREGLRSIWFKVCRLVQTPDHSDSINDIAGYARCLAMIVDARRMPVRGFDTMTLDEVMDFYAKRPHPLAGDPIEEQTFGPLPGGDPTCCICGTGSPCVCGSQ